MDARRLAGSLLVTGFDGPKLSARTERALARGERAGVILFRRNAPDVASIASIAAAVQATRPPEEIDPLLVAIDEEGGRVSRLPAPEVKLPPMRLVGRIGSADLARRSGFAVGARLCALGVNLDFAPILDVDSNPNNPVIGDRSFSSNPGVVAELALAFAQGLRDGGVLPCGKHFPGHGDTDKDSHHDLPVLTHDRGRLDAIELVPFRAACKAGIESIMSAHVVVRAFDPNVPATLSSSMMTDLLRTQLGFGGVLISDDLEMRAVAATYPVEESAVRAVLAGCDLLLVCSDEDLADRAHAALATEIEASSTFASRAREAAGRVQTLRARARTLAASSVPSRW
ncbi:MAG: beta-N-acetylhexosaminidase, partial [Polyangiaceae bacterium]|nr:beta-N-acetylhexosaminidase [Polyangiaceae bacterium]